MLGRRGMKLGAALTLCLSCSAVVGALVQARSENAARRAAEDHRPAQVRTEKYVSSNECRSCHPREYATWSSSFHRTMTQVATPRSVLGPFKGVSFGDDGQFKLGRAGDDFFVDMAVRPGRSIDRYPVTLVTGSHHMQTYWYETGHGKALGQLPIVYLNADRRWVPRDAIFIEPPKPEGAISEGRWNASCIACHTTLGQPRIDAQGEFDTQVAEFGIACEACHGPGEAHVANNASPLARYVRHFAGAGDSAIVQPKKLTHQRASYVCGQCHATLLYDSPKSMRNWNEHGPPFRPGGDLPESVFLLQPSKAGVDQRVAAVIERDRSHLDGQFWSDGVMRVSGREFNGMVDSPCYERGELACTSCHRMHQSGDDARTVTEWRSHQLAAGMETDQGCLQCHSDHAGKLEQHTHHAADSEGSRCYNCHMPYTSYGLLKSLRSHRIETPDVTPTLTTGRPNACNLCHLDKSIGWAAEQLTQRFGVASPRVEGDDASLPFAVLVGLKGDAGQRALVAWSLGWKPAQEASKLAFAPALLGVLMDDPYDAVRYIAERSLRTLGLDAKELGYDFVPRPAYRDSIAAKVAQRLQSSMSPAEQAQQRALFTRLLSVRDEKPVRLLE